MATIDEHLISNLLGVMHGLKRPLEKHIATAGLTAMQFAVMETLLHKGDQTVNEIIEGVFSTSGNISVVINRLINAGLLKKKSNPTDGRSRLICLTAKGEGKISSYYPSHKDELHRLMGGLKTDEKKNLIKALQSLRRSVEEKDIIKKT